MGWSEDIADMIGDRGRGCYYSTNMVQWRNDDGSFYRIYDRLDRDEYSVLVDGVKLEQAIEMTLGRGECKLQETCDDYVHIAWCRCNGCGEEVLAYPAKFCPNCGSAVKR